MLVDDHAMLRHGMAMLIDAEPDMQVVAEASDSAETLAFLKKNPDVDIILVDISLKTISKRAISSASSWPAEASSFIIVMAVLIERAWR